MWLSGSANMLFGSRNIGAVQHSVFPYTSPKAG
jgi:hypothetical protein